MSILRKPAATFFFLLPLLIILSVSTHVLGQEKIVMRIATWLGAEEIKIEESILAEFSALNPGVEVQVESIPNSYKEKILTSFAAGTVPDVFVLDSPIIPALLNKDVLLDLKPYTEELNVDLEDYFPNVLKIFIKGEKLYAFPKDYTTLMVFYNKTLFDNAGIPYPREGWTWDDYLETAKKLTIDENGDGVTDQYGTIFSNAFYLWEPFIWQAGGDYLDPEGTTARGFFNSPAAEKAMQFLIDLRIKHHVSPHGQTMGSTQSGAELFYSGKIGMVVSGHWRLAKIIEFMKKGELNAGVVHLPSPADGVRANIIYATGWCVPKNAKYPELSRKLAAFLGSERAAQIRLEYPVGIPGRIEASRQLIESDSYGVEQAFINSTKYGRQPWGTVIDDYRRVERVYEQAVDEVMIGGMDMHEAATEAAEFIDDVFARAAQFSDDVVDLKGNRQILSFFLVIVCLAGVALGGSILVNKGRERIKILKGYAFLAPSLMILLVFVLVPVIFSLYLSFHHWNVISVTKPFIGLENYKELFQDSLFWKAFKNTFVYSLHVPLGMAIALGIAMLLNRKIRGVNIFRTLFFLPSISSFVAVALVWKLMYHPQFGLGNYILNFFGISGFSWLDDPSTALFSVMIMSIWLGIGYQMVIFLAGLQGIPTELYESALTEGASAWQQFRHITLPLLKPTTFFILVTSLIGSFQVFALVYVMTKGGPLQSTDVIVYHIYQNAWDYLQMGYASAMSWVLFIVIMVITWVQFKFLGKKVYYN